MRPSNRSRILEAAIAVIERDGIAALTFDAVAAQADLTRGGIMYHFTSRAGLVAAIHEYQADRWVAAHEEVLDSRLGGAEPSDTDRARAYLESSSYSVSRAELQLQLEAAGDPAVQEYWTTASTRVLPPAPTDADDATRIRNLVAVLLADGLWIHEASAGRTLAPDVRRAVVEYARGVLDGEESSSHDHSPAPH
ncbi:TetR/AcrR family transcriptional regulator [Brevibacterium litoralis]|uniref:TetR/AcrR family transcriptional regulator n=1 Tax=Brevibacterium litoralis TaxID=3138935 RepID=UPI0032EC6B61